MARSIFQQIVLPYLAHTSITPPPHFVRFFSSNIARGRAAADVDPSTSSTAISHTHARRWDYVPPISPMPYDTGHDPPLRPIRSSSSSHSRPPGAASTPKRGSAGEVLAFLKSLEEAKGNRQATLMMALEKIASIPDSMVEREEAEEDRWRRRNEERDELIAKAGGKKGRIRADNGSQPINWNTSQTSNAPLTAQPLEPPSVTLEPSAPDRSPIYLAEKLKASHLPLVIYSLLRTRLYRLAVYHLLQTPEYAVDQPLLDRVAEYMKLDGAGKLARRLEKGWDGTLVPGDGSDPGEWDDDAPLPHRTPFGTIRRPRDAWLISRRAAASRTPSNPTLAALTANYNAHLTRSLLSTKKGSASSSTQSTRHSSNPLTPLNNMLTNSHPLQRPSGGMRQLRQLLHKIERLEKHREFRPDWVTANLVVKCWMSCLMAGGEGWRANERAGEIDKRGELRGLFGFVRALFEKGLEDQAVGEGSMAGGESAIHTTPGSSSTQSTTSSSPFLPRHPTKPKPYAYPQALSYTRHVRPFSNDLIRAFRQIDDRQAVGRVIQWQREMRDKLEGREEAVKVKAGKWSGS